MKAHPPLLTTPGTYRGPEQARRFFQDLLDPFEDVLAEPEEFFERGNQIAVFLLLGSRPKSSSAAMEIRIGHLWTMQDGKLFRLEIFLKREQALEAAGTSKQDAQANS
jgi:ketosteroid isomerase-like protein